MDKKNIFLATTLLMATLAGAAITGPDEYIYPARDQGHRIGPAVFGKFGIGGKQAIKYNAAYLIGKTRIDEDSYRGNTFPCSSSTSSDYRPGFQISLQRPQRPEIGAFF